MNDNATIQNPTSHRPTCPPREKLLAFLLGKLEPIELADCEEHLNTCSPCGDTIRGLDANDTLVGLAAQPQPPEGLHESDQFVVKMLIDKLQELSPSVNAQTTRTSLETPASRADEVIQFLQPADNPESLGRLAHYEIQQVLGVGATSVVFRAHDEQLHRQVALKVLRPSLGPGARERFLAEARAAAALDHENIITIYQVATEGHLAYMAQQWLPGETLESRLEQQPAFEIEEIKQLAIQLANGLASAHAKQLIHRDIKPANIWIESERNRSIILDFGLVRVADDGPQLTETGMIAGTPSFMSPEQTRGREIDARSDLFSLGCVLYRLCTGCLPFEAGNTLATLQTIQQHQPASPREINSQVPRDLSDLVMALLSKPVDGRPESAEVVVQALENPAQLKELLGRLPSPAAAASRSATKPIRSWRLWGAAALFLLALAAMLLAGPQIVRIVTNQGILEIKSEDPSVAIEVLKGGEVIYVIDQKTKQKLEIEAGQYKIRPAHEENSFQLSQDTVSMSRGGKVIVEVTRLKAQGDHNDNATGDNINPDVIATDETEAALESLYRSLYEKYLVQKRRFEMGDLDGFTLMLTQVELHDAEGDLNAARRDISAAAAAYREAIQLRKAILEGRQVQHAEGGDSLTSVADAKIDLDRAKTAYAKFVNANPGLVHLPDDAPGGDSELTFEGQTFEEWNEILRTERSASRLGVALQALMTLGQKDRPEDVAKAIMLLARSQGAFDIEQDSAEVIFEAARMLSQLDDDLIAKTALAEARKQIPESGEFLALMLPRIKSSYDPTATGQRDVGTSFRQAMTDLAEDYQQTLIEIIEDGGQENLDWSARLLAELTTTMEWERINRRQVVKSLQDAMLDVQQAEARVAVLSTLADLAPDTHRLEEHLLELLNRQPNSNWLITTTSEFRLARHSLRKLGAEHVSQAGVDQLASLVANQQIWIRHAEGTEPGPGDVKFDMIDTMVELSAGHDTTTVCKTLQAISEDLEDPYRTQAKDHLIKLSVPEPLQEFINLMQGSWTVVEIVAPESYPNQAEDEDRFELDIITLRGMKYTELRGTGFSESVFHAHLRFDGETINLLPLEAATAPIQVAYKLNGDELTWCYSLGSNSDRPTELKPGDSRVWMRLQKRTAR